MEWILKHYFGTHNCFYYLDNFFFVGLPQSDTCFKALSNMLLLCQVVQVPVKPEKVLDPTTTLPILGILLDTIAGEARLLEEKLIALQQELQHFQNTTTVNQTCTKRQLLSLIGKLFFGWQNFSLEVT